MKLEEYLEKIRTCPDEYISDNKKGMHYSRLGIEYGIHDNWPILLRGNYDTILRHLQESSTSNAFFQGEYNFKHQSIKFSWGEKEGDDELSQQLKRLEAEVYGDAGKRLDWTSSSYQKLTLVSENHL